MTCTCHLGIRPNDNFLFQKTSLGHGFNPYDPKNKRVCEFKLEFISYKKKMICTYVMISANKCGMKCEPI